MPLERLVPHEERAERERCDQGSLKPAIRPPPSEREREDHRESARQQDNRVEPAPEDIVDLPGSRPYESGERAVHPQEHVGTEERPEKRDLAEDENPHPEGNVFEAVERPLLPDGLDDLTSAERFVAPTDEGGGENPGPQEESREAHQEPPERDPSAGGDHDGPATPMFLARLRPVGTVRVSAVRHGHRPVRDAGGGDHRHAFREVELRGWRRDAPLERISAPWILTRLRSTAGTPEKVGEHDELREAEYERANRDDQIDWAPSRNRVVREDSARHIIEEMHGEVEQVEPNHVDDKVDFAESFEVPASRDLWEPVVKPGEEPGQPAADDRVVEVAHDPECSAEPRVERDRGVEHAGYAADDEQPQRPGGKEHRGREPNPTAAQGEDVRHNDDGERDRDEFGRDVERLEEALRDARHEHVVGPHREAQDASDCEAGDDNLLRIERPTAERRE